jgi:hypothetical protein
MCIVTNDFACIFSNVHFTRHEVGMNEQTNFEVEEINRAKNLFSNVFAKSKNRRFGTLFTDGLYDRKFLDQRGFT